MKWRKKEKWVDVRLVDLVRVCQAYFAEEDAEFQLFCTAILNGAELRLPNGWFDAFKCDVEETITIRRDFFEAKIFHSENYEGFKDALDKISFGLSVSLPAYKVILCVSKNEFRINIPAQALISMVRYTRSDERDKFWSLVYDLQKDKNSFCGGCCDLSRQYIAHCIPDDIRYRPTFRASTEDVSILLRPAPFLQLMELHEKDASAFTEQIFAIVDCGIQHGWHEDIWQEISDMKYDQGEWSIYNGKPKQRDADEIQMHL